MTFKEFFLVQERTYHFDISAMTDQLIGQLQEKIANKKEVKSGDTFTLAIDEFHDVDVKFLKRLSKAARQYKQEGEVISAMYFPETKDDNGRIEIYINPSKKQEGYYKERNFEDFVNKSLPKYIKNIIRHELTHAIEDIIQDTLQYDDTDPTDWTEEYSNSPAESNAQIIQFIRTMMEKDRLLQYHILRGDVREATKFLINKSLEKPYFSQQNQNARRRTMRSIYDFVQTLIDKSRAYGMGSPTL